MSEAGNKENTSSSGNQPHLVPNLSELIIIVHHEIQRSIEYLSQQELHKIHSGAPSSSLVKLESIQIEMPVQMDPQVGKITQGQVETILQSKSFHLFNKQNLPLEMKVHVQGPNNTDTTKEVGRLKFSFSIASK